MLDWSDDEDEGQDDNMDDDDDTPDSSGGFQDKNGSSDQQRDDQRDPRGKRNGDDSNGGNQGSFSGFGRFQLSNLSDSGCAEQPIIEHNTDKRELTSTPPPSDQYCVPRETSSSDEPARDDSLTLARDAVSKPVNKDLPQLEHASPEPSEIYQCTSAATNLGQKHSWKRHEESGLIERVPMEQPESRHQDPPLDSAIRCLMETAEGNLGRQSLLGGSQLQIEGIPDEMEIIHPATECPSSELRTSSESKPLLQPPLLVPDQSLSTAAMHSRNDDDESTTSTLMGDRISRDAEAVSKHQRTHEQEKQKRSIATTRGSDHTYIQTPDELTRHLRLHGNTPAESTCPTDDRAGMLEVKVQCRYSVRKLADRQQINALRRQPIDALREELTTIHASFAKAETPYGHARQDVLNLLTEVIYDAGAEQQYGPLTNIR
jgi:hypothetical protein